MTETEFLSTLQRQFESTPSFADEVEFLRTVECRRHARRYTRIAILALFGALGSVPTLTALAHYDVASAAMRAITSADWRLLAALLMAPMIKSFLRQSAT